jgi:hypothetical protein
LLISRSEIHLDDYRTGIWFARVFSRWVVAEHVTTIPDLDLVNDP